MHSLIFQRSYLRILMHLIIHLHSRVILIVIIYYIINLKRKHKIKFCFNPAKSLKEKQKSVGL